MWNNIITRDKYRKNGILWKYLQIIERERCEVFSLAYESLDYL